jgi:4-amino-4-deoxy-L-arabinose transferase-like glycosyltransferase
MSMKGHQRRWVAAVAAVVLAALVVRLGGIGNPSVESRELHNALVARQLYHGDGDGLPEWKRTVLQELRDVAQPIEPPILDALAAAGFKLVGGEELWIPRLLSSVLWVVGGLFLFQIASRLTSRSGAFIALVAYLFWPYAVWLSRLYMPDGAMVACLLLAALTVIRYWERPTRRRLLVAGGVASVAAVLKPGVALVFLVALFVALARSQRALRASIADGRLPLFAALVAALPLGYYLYGTHIRNFLADETGGRVEPSLLSTEAFWQGWWDMISTVLVFPQPQTWLAVPILALAFCGLLVVPRGLPRAVLAGLAAGYVVFGLAVPGFTSTHAYYSLPLIPLLALALGALGGWVIRRARSAGRWAHAAAIAAVGLALGGAVYKGHAVLDVEPPNRAIADYRAIGEITGHTANAIVVDLRLRSPISYWGWMVARYWYPPTPAEDLPTEGDPFPSWIDARKVDYLVVLDLRELDTEPRLRSLAQSVPVVARTARYAVFDLRGGRAHRWVEG